MPTLCTVFTESLLSSCSPRHWFGWYHQPIDVRDCRSAPGGHWQGFYQATIRFQQENRLSYHSNKNRLSYHSNKEQIPSKKTVYHITATRNRYQGLLDQNTGQQKYLGEIQTEPAELMQCSLLCPDSILEHLRRFTSEGYSISRFAVLRYKSKTLANPLLSTITSFQLLLTPVQSMSILMTHVDLQGTSDAIMQISSAIQSRNYIRLVP